MTLENAVFLTFARGEMGLRDPGKRGFLTFARGSVRNLTLANAIFSTLPGSELGCMTLANYIFQRLPGATFMNKTAPPSPSSAALRLNCAAIPTSSGAPLQQSSFAVPQNLLIAKPRASSTNPILNSRNRRDEEKRAAKRRGALRPDGFIDEGISDGLK